MQSSKTKRNLQIMSAILFFLTIFPYLYLLFNVGPVYSYGQETGGNALLQIYIPLCLIGLLGSASFLLLLISLIAKDRYER